MTNQYDVYDAEAELLDMAADAAINERPFYQAKELGSLTDQVHLLDHITAEAQADYFEEWNLIDTSASPRNMKYETFDEQNWDGYEGSDTCVKSQLDDAGFGSMGVM